ncbi:MAG: site-specific recombinase, phage integrase family [Clostridiaceae bacterium]|nr:site-specific recombinase, phage integrase family [Clostridiaceae bacterium]
MDYNVTYREKDKGIQAIISYKDATGRWKQKSKQGFKTQKASKPWIEDVVKELEETIKYINPELKETKLNELFNYFIEHAELHKETNTLISYDGAFKHFENIKDSKVAEIGTLEIQHCVDNMIRNKLMQSTIKTYVAKMKVIFNYAISPLKIIKDNPFGDVSMPAKIKTEKKIKALTESELNDLLNKMVKYKHYYIISLLAATCGLRIGEILGLNWNDIDEKKSTMNINKQWKLIIKKPLTCGIGPVKSTNSNREIPIPPKTLDALLKYKKEHPINISGRIISYKRTDSTCSNLTARFKKNGYDISIHDLRHTYASMLVANGVDFKTVAELMGDTVQVVIDTYSHFTSDMMTKAQKAVNSIF